MTAIPMHVVVPGLRSDSESEDVQATAPFDTLLNTLSPMPYTPSSTTSHARLAADTATQISAIPEPSEVSHADPNSEQIEAGPSSLPERGAIGNMLQDGSNAGVDEKDEEERTPQSILPPSPPLTRVGTNDSKRSKRHSHTSPEVEEVEETGVGWHPLILERTDSRRENGHQTQESAVDEEEDIAGEPVVFANDEKSSSRRSRHLHLNIQPPSPQPWDLVDPPETNGLKPEYFSTIGSQKFSTLQSKATSRPPIPQSSFYFGPPPADSAYGTNPVGQIGLHHPREILRVERDYTGGEVIQFAPIFPLELDGRISPTQFLESINSINEILISAHSLRRSFFDNVLTVFTLQLSRLFITTHYEKEMQRLERLFELLNAEVYNPVGLNLVWPRKVAFLFLEIEYY
jgi:hypothetical protein